MLNIAVIGCGYWGPNLIRNVVNSPSTNLITVCDINKKRLQQIMKLYPGVIQTTHLEDVLHNKEIQAVIIATPVHTHFTITKECLLNGKHVLVEKPLASSVIEGMELVQLAQRENLKLMCDHTFCYTSAARKIKEIIASGEIGQLLYFDSIRINLGLFQPDVNVLWDLAPHDLSILDFFFSISPKHLTANGFSCSPTQLESIAYLCLRYNKNFIAHFHLNWLSPVKIRQIIIGGSEKMIVWNDLDPVEKIKVYNKGIEVTTENIENVRKHLISYRSGEIYIPKIEEREALATVIEEFAESIEKNRRPLTDGEAGLRILKILEKAQYSIQNNGIVVEI